ncbi:hypothetical protein RND81_09G038900 [Saponaria officinalis]|uniref:Uncharacterized protein n=1 Tax=Saponaria officinalis TaxID=3572 RepID=A0AAW1IHL4_SAPOF
MGKKINETTGKMTQLCREIVHVNINLGILNRVDILRRFFRQVWDSLLGCSGRHCFGKKPDSPNYYRRLRRKSSPATAAEMEEEEEVEVVELISGYDSDSDVVHLKISLLGDCHIGKTSFLIKYVGDEQERKSLEMKGLNLMDKIMVVSGARIASTIWDVAGDQQSLHHVPIACKDAVAILFMFDLTSRCTLNSVIGWYDQAMKWNKAAIPILIGTKFDDFVKLPPDLQWTIVTQVTCPRPNLYNLFTS